MSEFRYNILSGEYGICLLKLFTNVVLPDCRSPRTMTIFLKRNNASTICFSINLGIIFLIIVLKMGIVKMVDRR